jgi:hypothetical protein
MSKMQTLRGTPTGARLVCRWTISGAGQSSSQVLCALVALAIQPPNGLTLTRTWMSGAALRDRSLAIRLRGWSGDRKWPADCGTDDQRIVDPPVAVRGEAT